jgi:hypothetical protein
MYPPSSKAGIYANHTTATTPSSRWTSRTQVARQTPMASARSITWSVCYRSAARRSTLITIAFRITLLPLGWIIMDGLPDLIDEEEAMNDVM